MIASQKSHIDELVQKTRTLDNTIKTLQDQLSTSRTEWQAERKEWADGCDSLMACHRIAHLRTNLLLAQERVALAHERDLTRRERTAVIQRDYNLILFKAREKELELEADQLKEELRGAADGNVALVAELREKLAEGMRELKEKAVLLRDAEKAREEAEVRRSTLPHLYTRILTLPCFFLLIFLRNRPPTFAPNMLPCRRNSRLLVRTRKGLRCASRTLRLLLPRRKD
jgi:chromosome segregation ATPase